MSEQATLFVTNPTANYRLWKYAVLVSVTDPKTGITYWYVKDGDHRCDTYEQALAYAASETVGKIRGLLTEEMILGVWDMTEHAISIDPAYDPTLIDTNYRKGYDNAIRDNAPLRRKRMRNFLGQQSLEVHPIPKKYIDEKGENWLAELKYDWNNFHEVLQQFNSPKPEQFYIARPYLDDAREKINRPNSVKHLLAATTGGGKETSTLALLIEIHDVKQISTRKIHMALATIPSTVSEQFEELANVAGMHYGLGDSVEFDRIKPYVTDAWHKSHYAGLTVKAKRWYLDNVNIIKTARELPKTHTKETVPVLFGSLIDVALKSGESLQKRYAGLDDRIGTLAVLEAHKILAEKNKLWQNIKKIKKQFFLVVTGTPYDFIFGEEGDLFFPPENRSMFTRTDLLFDKHNNPESHYINYPDYNYYSIKGLQQEVIEELKKDPRWEEDAEGFTWDKLHSVEDGEFVYKQHLIYFYSRMLGLDSFNDGLNIDSAPGLCEIAKRHIIIGLPTGTAEAGVDIYIPALVRLLKDNGALGNYKPMVAYEDTLGDIKTEIKDNETATVTFTCIKHLTGANIPAWGSFIMLRRVGDSIKFFEQATGRPGRSYYDKSRKEWKANCGIFLGDLEAAMNITVTVEEKLALERGENTSTAEIFTRTLNCYQFFNSDKGRWEQIQLPDMVAEMEKLSTKGNYGVGMCVKKTLAPTDFDEVFKNTVAKESVNVAINTSGNKGAKDIIKKSVKQLELDLNSQKDADKWYHNMKKQMIARLRVLSYIEKTDTVQDCVEQIYNAIANEDKKILDIMGRTINYVHILLDPEEIDVRYTNRWINKLHMVKEINDLFELLEDPLLRDDLTNFVAEPNRLCRRASKSLLRSLKNKKSPVIGDLCAGRGAFLIHLLDQAKELNIDVKPNNVYYNDIDPVWVELFRTINEEFKIGIPASNITCVDAMEITMKFDGICINAPYDKGDQEGGQNKIYNQINKKALELLNDDGVLVSISPTSVLKKSKRFSLVGQQGLKEVDFTANDDFTVGVKICQWTVDKSYTGDVKVIDSSGFSTQSNQEVIYDYSTVDKDFVKIYEALKEITDTPPTRMFQQNNFGPALNKTQTKEHEYKLYKLDENKVNLTYFSKRVPYNYGKLQISLGMTKALDNKCIYVGTEDFDPGYMNKEVNSDYEVENIKSFILSDYFIEHSNSWKTVDGYGYNYALKYLPPFDTSKQWDNDSVKHFIEGFVK